MKKLAHRLTLAIVSACFLTGCTMGHAPVVSLITLEEKGPVAVGPAAGSSKVGRSEAWGILVFATGDASISAAMRNGGITRIHHVDHETSSFLGVYAKYTTIVSGAYPVAPLRLISASARAASAARAGVAASQEVQRRAIPGLGLVTVREVDGGRQPHQT